MENFIFCAVSVVIQDVESAIVEAKGQLKNKGYYK